MAGSQLPQPKKEKLSKRPHPSMRPLPVLVFSLDYVCKNKLYILSTILLIPTSNTVIIFLPIGKLEYPLYSKDFH